MVHSNLGEIKKIHINWKYLGEVHQFTKASFNCGNFKQSYSKLGNIE